MTGQLIVTGDDFGLSASVNRAIEECLTAGTMAATCVMANMPHCGEAAALKREFPDRSVGIHWNLTQGSPVLHPARVPTLVDADGQFVPSLRRRWLAREISVVDVRAELRAQYERLRDFGLHPDFWNSHQDSHVYPGLFQIFVQVGKELGIRAMRSHRRFTVPRGSSALRYSLGHPTYWIKGRLIARWCRQAEAAGMLMPAGRLHAPGYNFRRASLHDALSRIDWSSLSRPIELAIHPATRLEGSLFGSLTESRLKDYAVFRDPKLKESLNRSGIECVGFEVLGPRGSGARKGIAA